ncbi:seed lectin alpha chain-like [Tripterygium wilfordii]|uniref:seed lectin alpha chain-like n=1 Tax=Tripterygium wilfordii TaxID=458696 RepID=UPI0018F82E31|nr:seed lectin alpha chain-like [Tripterygium wilfordii]
MKQKFAMNYLGLMNYFLRIEVDQKQGHVFICQQRRSKHIAIKSDALTEAAHKKIVATDFCSSEDQHCFTKGLLKYKFVDMRARLGVAQALCKIVSEISTIRIIRILTSSYSTESADGLTFIMAPNSNPSPADSFGSYLGIMDPAQDGRVADQLAVEFDTYKNTFDLDGNHVSIDTKSVLHPIYVRSLNETGIDLKSGKDIKVSIILDGRANSITMYVGYASELRRELFLDVPIDIPHTLPSFIYVGFTASTGYLTESHQILSWSLSSYPIPKK